MSDQTGNRYPLLCGERQGDVYCTRPHGHEDDHIATYGPWTFKSKAIARWPQKAKRKDRR